MVKISNMKTDLGKAYREEEVYWKEKSKERWLEDGDKNSSFFHGSVQTRKMRNKVSSLLDKDGVEHFSEEDKGQIAVEYFQDLFTASSVASTDELLRQG